MPTTSAHTLPSRLAPPAPTVARQVLVALAMLGAVTLTAGLGILANRGNIEGWYADADKVAWNPPPFVFGPVWTVLYLLIAIAGFLLWRQGYRGIGRENAARGLLMLFGIQLAFNAAWSPLFFAGYPAWGEIGWWLALAIIVVMDMLVLCLALASAKSYPWVARLLAPYLAWILYATTLNIGIIALNSH